MTLNAEGRKADIRSPEWHQDVLGERDRLVASGEDSFVNCDVTERELLEELP